MKKLSTIVKQCGGKAYKFFEIKYVPEEPIDWTNLKNKEGFTKKAFCLLTDPHYARPKGKLFDKIIQSERHDRYAYYKWYEEQDEALCNSALVYTADLLDHGKAISEVSDTLGLQPGTVVEIMKFFSQIDDLKEAAE